MTETDLAYLAGIIDGEGSVSLFHRGDIHKGYVTPALQVSNTDKRLIDWLHESRGGRVYQMPEHAGGNRKPCWLWCCFGKTARSAIQDTRPYLRVKDRQADLVLSLGEGGPRNQSRPLTDAERAQRIEAVVQMRELNRRGTKEPV